MDVLVLTAAADGRTVLPALELLAHPVRTAAPSVAAFLAAPAPDVVLVDGRTQPSAAATLAGMVAATDREVPVVGVAAEATLAGLPAGAALTQLVLDTAGPAEVDARLRLSQRSRAPEEAEEPVVLKVGPFELDTHAYTITIDERPLSLTHHEFELFRALLTHAGRPLSRERLLDRIGGWEASPRAIDCHVRALRSKLGEHRTSIRTVRGLGYLAAAS